MRIGIAQPLVTCFAIVVVLFVATGVATAASGSMRYVHAMTPCDLTEDGANVRVFRCLGGYQSTTDDRSGENKKKRMTLDPFLIFDAYRNTERSQFQGGFPAHPHRGFLELRYIVEGALAHNDSCGNRGVTQTGGVQALFTGRGIVHEELPLQVEDTTTTDSTGDRCGMHEGSHRLRESHGPVNKDVFRGFQIWINVPNSVRDSAPAYRTFPRDVFPTYHLPAGTGVVTLFAGQWPGMPTSISSGPITDWLPWNTGLLFAEVDLSQKHGEKEWVHVGAANSQHVLLYVLRGVVLVGDDDEEGVSSEMFAFLGPGDVLRVKCGGMAACKFILMTAPRVREAVIVSGGFVASSEAGIQAAMEDLHEGTNTHC